MKTKVPIKIDIKDPFKYGVVAFFVDQSDFLEVVLQAREDLGINRLLSRDETKSLQLGITSRKDTLIKNKKILTSVSDSKKIIKRSFDVVTNLYQYYQGIWYFQDVILFSILSGVVREEDINTKPFFVSKSDFYQKKGSENVGEGSGAIMIFPYTSDKEVLSVLHNFRKRLNIPDTISNIRRDREWYWQHMGGSSYQTIWKKHKGQDKPFNRDGVIKAIKQYKERLNLAV